MNKLRFILYRYVKLIAIGYILVCGLLYVFQRKLIYQPSHELIPLPKGFVPWILKGQLIGYKRVTGTMNCLFFLHGNAGNATGWADATIEFSGDVFVLEYPGYGEREGIPTEASLRIAALEAFDSLPAYLQIIVCGQSLGSGVAGPLMKERSELISHLILITPFTSLSDLARAKFPWLPTRWLLKDPMEVYDLFLCFKGRTTVILAQNDEIIPRSARENFARVTGHLRRVITIKGVNHNGIHLNRLAWLNICKPDSTGDLPEGAF